MAKKENLGRLTADHDDHLIQLQINQDVGSQAWTKFMIAIQGGLGTAFGYILLSEKLSGVKTILAIAIAFVAICTCVVIRKIIERHHRWSAWYIIRYGLLPGNRDFVFPIPVKPIVPTTIDEAPVGVIGGLIVRFCEVTIVIWLMALIVVLVLWAQ